MKTIVCYGDSNTWGYVPITTRQDAMWRYPADVRWTGAMAAALGAGYSVIEEGLNGRTTVWDDPMEEGRSGKAYLLPCLLTHQPIELLIIMLGTNDLKARFAVTPSDIADGVGVLIDIAQRSGAGSGGAAPRILIVCPPPLAPLAGTPLEQMFAGGEEKSRGLSAQYARVAAAHGVAVFDAGTVAVCSPRDAIHYEQEEHAKLGAALAGAVRELLANA